MIKIHWKFIYLLIKYLFVQLDHKKNVFVTNMFKFKPCVHFLYLVLFFVFFILLLPAGCFAVLVIVLWTVFLTFFILVMLHLHRLKFTASYLYEYLTVASIYKNSFWYHQFYIFEELYFALKWDCKTISYLYNFNLYCWTIF